MACAHEGDVERARSLVSSIAAADAEVIQFELLEPDANIIPGTEVYEDLQRLYLEPEEWVDLFEHARAEELTVSTYAYDAPSLRLGLDLETDLVKFNSSDLLNPEMLDEIARSGTPCLLGTGASTPSEIAQAVDFFLTAGGTDLVLMHGVQNFPTELEHAHIRRMGLLREAFDALVGYSDHTDADTDISKVIDLVALGMGACVIEKHVTPDRSERGTDHEAALEPREFRAFVQRIAQASKALGPERFTPLTESDRSYRRFQKKAIVASKALEAGTVLSEEDLSFLRIMEEPPISPIDVDRLVGASLTVPVDEYEAIRWADIALPSDAR